MNFFDFISVVFVRMAELVTLLKVYLDRDIFEVKHFLANE